MNLVRPFLGMLAIITSGLALAQTPKTDYKKLQEKIENYASKIEESFDGMNNLNEIRQKIATDNYSAAKVEDNLKTFSNSLAQNSTELKKVELGLSSSLANWQPKVGTFYKDFYKFYPYSINANANVDFQNELGYADLGIFGFEVNASFSAGVSLFALDNLGIALLSGALNGNVKLDSLKVMHRVLGNNTLKQACSEESLAMLFGELGDLDQDSLQKEQIVSPAKLKELATLVCSMSSDVTAAEEFNQLVRTLGPKFQTLEDELGSVLKAASKSLGEAFADMFDYGEGKLSKVSGATIKTFVDLFSSYKLKADNCTGLKFSKCTPHIVIKFSAQPLLGETAVSFVLAKDSAKISWTGEVVPYAVNFITEDVKRDMFVYTYVAMKTIESLTTEEMRLLGEFTAEEFEEMSKDIAKFLAPSDQITDPNDLDDVIDLY